MKYTLTAALLALSLAGCATAVVAPAEFTSTPVRDGEYNATLTGKPGASVKELKKQFDAESAQLCGKEKTYLLRGLKEEAHMKPVSIKEPAKREAVKPEAPKPEPVVEQKKAKGKKAKAKKVKTVVIVPPPVVEQPPINPSEVDYYVLKGRVGCVGADYFQ